MTPDIPHFDYYGNDGHSDDAGYLRDMVDACRAAVSRLPSFHAVAEHARRSALRIIDYQTLIDDEPESDYRPFAQWAIGQNTTDLDMRWWETGAACGSSLMVFVLLAGAADPSFREQDAAKVEHTYFPWIGALHTLLDNLIDYPEDTITGQHNLIEHYGTPESLADRMHVIGTEAARRVQALPDSTNHTLVLAGMASLYLSSPHASLHNARLAGKRVLAAIGPLTTPTMLLFSIRRALHRDTPTDPLTAKHHPA
jgi:tetraprenyl-beta-curcumene synthase